MDMNTILLAACAVLLVLVVISLIMNMVNSSKINTLLDFSEDGDLVVFTNANNNFVVLHCSTITRRWTTFQALFQKASPPRFPTE